jgi:hypothetical protein
MPPQQCQRGTDFPDGRFQFSAHARLPVSKVRRKGLSCTEAGLGVNSGKFFCSFLPFTQ